MTYLRTPNAHMFDEFIEKMLKIFACKYYFSGEQKIFPVTHIQDLMDIDLL
ncbi:MAG: hypothetical protein ACR2KX_13030 [Chitinophagaceae bacterium]